MAYYTVGGVPVNDSHGSSSVIRSEFTNIQTGFATAETAIGTKGAITGQTWTGTHTFPATTYGVTAAFGSSGTAFATLDFVNAVATNAALPSQTGNSGKYLKTNGTTASWSALSGQDGTTITGNVTLTASSAGAMVVTPSGYGLYATLLDATTGIKGVVQFSIYNAGYYDYGIKNNAGTILGWVRPLTSANISLADNSTAAGIWGATGVAKIAETAQYNNLTATGSSTTTVRVTIDSTREMFLWGDTTVYATVFDESDNTFGSAYTVRTGIGSGLFTGILTATDVILVTSCDSTTGFEAVTLSIAGKVVTVNSGTKATKTLGGNIQAFGNLVAVGSSWCTGWRRTSSIAEIVGISISGTTPTFGTVSALDITSNSLAPLILVTGSDIRAVCINATQLSCKPYTISGSTLTAGTAATVTTSSVNIFKAIVNGNGNVLVQYPNSSLQVTIFKLTATVEAASTVNTTMTSSAQSNTYTAHNIISASKTFISNIGDSSSDTTHVIVTDTAGTASIGSVVTVNHGIAGSAITPLASSGNNMRVMRTGSGNTVTLTFDCSGSSPTLSAERYFNWQTSQMHTGSAGQDKYGNLPLEQLRTTSRDVITGAGYLSYYSNSGSKDVLDFTSTKLSSCAGKAQSIGWQVLVPTSIGISLTRIEVAE